MPALSRIRIVATGVVLVVFVAAAALSVASIARPTFWFPAFVSIAGALAAAYSLAQDLVKARRGESSLDDEVTDLGASVSDVAEGETAEETRVIRRRVLVWALWLLALPVLALVIPFFYASLIWLVAVLRVSGRKSWLSIAISVIVFGVVLNVLVVLLEIHMPPAMLTGWG